MNTTTVPLGQQPGGDPDQGFTLIELLVVIVVLGILATVVTIGVLSISDDAEASACQATAATVENMTTAYQVRYPGTTPSIGDLVLAGFLDEDPRLTFPGMTITNPSSVCGSISGPPPTAAP